MANLLLEIFSEEIPAGMQKNAAETFAKNLEKALNKMQGNNLDVSFWFTPRRLGFHVENVEYKTVEVTEEIRGPKIDAPEQAIAGFMNKYGSDKSKTVKKDGRFFFNQTYKLDLKDVIEDLLNSFVWPKSMRWGEHKKTWVRPLQSILCLFNSEIVEVSYDGIIASNKTTGHRFMSNGKSFSIKNYDDYKSKLLEKNVILDFQDRKQMILSQLQEKLTDDLRLIEDKNLIAEITGLVEYPIVHIGRIDKKFMSLPREVLQIALKVHQRYLMLENKDGDLAPYFVIVSNIEATDGGKALIAGNEKVLSARLADAMFFYDLDKKSDLESKLEKLKKVTFHKEIGSVFDKANELQNYSSEISKFLKANNQQSILAAKICKADLVTEMVKEFPELQGIMGGYYAHNDGLDKSVAIAVSDHYKPTGPNDSLPSNDIGMVISIADKLVTLNSLFAINVKPTGSKDPYALRRAANGIIRMIGSDQIDGFFELLKSKNMIRTDVEQYIREREIL